MEHVEGTRLRHSASREKDIDLLLAEISSYRERWRATQRLGEQRFVMLLTVLASVIASSGLLLTADEVGRSTLSSEDIVGFLWTILAIVAQGTYVRLISVRRSIYGSIVCLNYLRRALIQLARRGRSASTLAAVLAVDSTLPSPFRLLSLPSAAALMVSCSVLIASSQFIGGSNELPLVKALVMGSVVLLGNLSWYWFHASRFRRRFSELVP